MSGIVLPGALPDTVFPLVGASPQGLAIAAPGLDVRSLATLIVLHALCSSGGVVTLGPASLIAHRAAEIADATLARLRARESGPASPIPGPAASGPDQERAP